MELEERLYRKIRSRGHSSQELLAQGHWGGQPKKGTGSTRVLREEVQFNESFHRQTQSFGLFDCLI